MKVFLQKMWALTVLGFFGRIFFFFFFCSISAERVQQFLGFNDFFKIKSQTLSPSFWNVLWSWVRLEGTRRLYACMHAHRWQGFGVKEKEGREMAILVLLKFMEFISGGGERYSSMFWDGKEYFKLGQVNVKLWHCSRRQFFHFWAAAVIICALISPLSCLLPSSSKRLF